MALNLIMLGPPGAGKGTQAEKFGRENGLPKISTGDILREAVQSGSEIGLRAKAVMERGELVSDDLIIGIVQARLDRPDVARGFILDGFPRTVAQARALDGIMIGRSPLVVVDIAVPESELVRRLATRMVCESCGNNAPASAGPSNGPERCERCGGRLVQRADDNEAVVRERLKVYRRDTQPLVEYYRTRDTFRAIDGAQPPEKVAEAIDRAVASLAGECGGKEVRR
ncbi:MAG: adenylate kinase [Vicinamibacterales bacterium]